MDKKNESVIIPDEVVGRIMSKWAYIGVIGGLIGTYYYIGVLDKKNTNKLLVGSMFTIAGLAIGSFIGTNEVNKLKKQ